MTDSACETPANAGINGQRAGCFQHSDPPNQSDPDVEDRAMAVEPYNARNAGCQQEQTTNWRSIGELAAELVRKAGDE